MRQKMFWLAAVLAVALLPASAGAAVNNTHHDMSVYIGGGQAFVCYYCHGIKDANVTDQGLGTVGNLCYNRCHSAGGIAGAGTGGLAPLGPFKGDPAGNGLPTGTQTLGITVLSTSHGMSLSIPAPDLNASVSGSNFPHTSAFPTDRMECTSCHNVHSNTFAPFLNKSISDNDVSTFTPGDTLCTTCHAGAATAPFLRYALITSVRAEQGGHVIELPLNATGAAGRNTLGRNGRTISLKGSVLDTPTANSTALNAPATHYDTGGHLGDFAAANADPGTTGGNIGCYTCHSAHMPSALNNQLLITAENGQYNPVAGSVTAPLCITCHGAAATPNNPGTTAYYHPANGEAVRPYEHTTTYWGQTGTWAIVINTTWPTGAVTGNPGTGAGQDAITCSTCHDVHPSAATGGQMAIRNLGQAAGAPVCAGCHQGGEGAGTARNAHHLTGTADFTATPYGFTNPSWTAAQFGNLADGLACHDCHVFNQTAHNW